MDPTSPSAPVRRSQLLTSISELRQGIQATEADIDRIENRISYKEDWLKELKSERIAADIPKPAIDKAIKQTQSRIKEVEETLIAKKDEIARLKSRLQKKETKLAAIPQIESSSAPNPKDNEDAVALLEVTATPVNAIFTISEDGKTYTNPPMLRGVPVAPISETGSYWNPLWKKFAEAVNEEKVEREYQEYLLIRHQRMLQGPLPASEDDPEHVFKRYQRSLRQAKVTKQWFSPGHTIHPNQLMAKEHLPETGICDNYVLYKICNILSRINAMYERGEVGMPPMHFLMWRMSVSLERFPHDPMKSFWRVMVDKNHNAYDSILRQAEIRGAQHTGDYNFYLGRWKQASSARDQTHSSALTGSRSAAPDTAIAQPGAGSHEAFAQQQQQQQQQNLREPVSNLALNPIEALRSQMQMQTSSTQGEGRHVSDRRKTHHSSEAFDQSTPDHDGSHSRPAKRLRQLPLFTEDRLAVRSRPSAKSMVSSHSLVGPIMETGPPMDLEAKIGHEAHTHTSTFRVVDAPMEDELQLDSFEKSMADNDDLATEATAPILENTSIETPLDNREWIDMFVGSEEIRRQIQPTNMEAIRAAVGESPFPKDTGRRVSHGFVFPWYHSEEAQKLDELGFPF
ncbi:LOW QUALITY PROTEIN: uncharacterized protein BDZ83DRAFT_718528 [Colletotrichum acutatum]|uniref:Uncharacterized protein n=1 Tax=Glomerella acutata TaxID=27357 RepID=A0AAD8US58_GLOAC|nr:LOW QUALITY PROTEIN: uncharacterized protein BDZ83DRAFT_718528 [Colletotrichum acutatum]KAK1726311.1 LOW QUALITY PROTEIN: hypothetical protein BDZ83DRAFT_718528 [Colletotrichum acutatum]